MQTYIHHTYTHTLIDTSTHTTHIHMDIPIYTYIHIHKYMYTQTNIHTCSWWMEQSPNNPHFYSCLFASLYLLGQISLCEKKDYLIQKQIRCYRRGSYSRIIGYKFKADILSLIPYAHFDFRAIVLHVHDLRLSWCTPGALSMDLT